MLHDSLKKKNHINNTNNAIAITSTARSTTRASQKSGADISLTTSDSHNINYWMKARRHKVQYKKRVQQAALILLTGDMESTQAPSECVKQQSRDLEESSIHPNLTWTYSSSSYDSILSNWDPVSTTPSIIITAKNDIPESDVDQDFDPSLSLPSHNIAARVKARRAALISSTDDMVSTQASYDRTIDIKR